VQFITAPAEKFQDRLVRPVVNVALPFYRRFPYSGPCSLFHLNVRGAFSPTDGFFYNRIPKAANSTVSKALALHSNYTRMLPGRGDKGRMKRPSFMRPSEVSKIGTDAIFAFTVVRNPYSRTLSAYRDKILGRRRQTARFVPMMDETTDGVPSFVEFCRFLDRGGVYLDAHWAPQTDLMLLPLSLYNAIGKVESLDADMASILKGIWGNEVTTPLIQAGPRTDARAHVQYAYDDECKAIVDKLYHADFRSFGYDMTL
jgi:hypothetical protein